MDLEALELLRSNRFFESWNGFVPAEKISASEEALRSFLNRLIQSGPTVDEALARAYVDDAVRLFNDLDDGWIVTTEREDICDRISDILAAAGFEPDEDWFCEREW